MTDLRDKLLALDREGLEQEASRLGIMEAESMSRAELIIAIEKANAHRELADIQEPLKKSWLKKSWEYRVLFYGFIFVTIATIVLAIDTYLLLTGLHGVFFDVALSLVPSFVYLVFRVLGGCLIAAALISLGFQKGDERMTPVVRGALIIVAVLVIIIVVVSVPFPGSWLLMSP